MMKHSRRSRGTVRRPTRSFYQLMGVDEPIFDPEHRFVTSWLLTPTLLACLRGLIALYCSAVIITIYSYDAAHGDNEAIDRSFSFFTTLTYWGLTFYFLVSTLHTAVYARTGYTWLRRWPRPLQALHSLFYTTIITFPFLVTLVFWIVLYKAPWYAVVFEGWSNVSQHGLNSLFALLELILPATAPPPWLHLPFLITILLLYLALAYLTHATEGFYTYDFLDPANGKGMVAAYSCGIAAAIVVIFLVVWGIIRLRNKFTGLGKKSQRDLSRGETYPDTETTEMAIR